MPDPPHDPSLASDHRGAPTTAAPGPTELLRSRSYLLLLVLGALTGVPVAVMTYLFLKAVDETQEWVFAILPSDLGIDAGSAWWPIVPLTIAGLVVALVIRLLPGEAGHKPAEGFTASGPVQPIELPGIIGAAFVTLGLGVVLGPEAPLIAIGSGLGVLAISLVKRDAPEVAVAVIAAAGSFAAISTLLGSPLLGAFLLMEAAGLGPMTGAVLVPGLLGAGIGSLIYVGLNSWTGFGTFSLAIPDIPPAGSPTLMQFLWAIAIGLLAAVLGTSIKRSALRLQSLVERRMVLLMPLVGAFIGVVTWVFVVATDEAPSAVLFSGEAQLGPLIVGASDWTTAALLLLIACKSLAYAASLSCFRGGPVFPGMLIGAAGGIVLSQLPGLPLIAGVGMGIGAMTVAMLRLPMVSVLLVTLFLQDDGLQLAPVVIVSVAVSYVASHHLDPPTIAPTPAPTS